jgi:hypothetical protein
MRLFKAKNSSQGSHTPEIVDQIDSVFNEQNGHTVSLHSGVRIAKNSTNKMRRILEEKNEKETVTMSEKKTNTPAEEEQAEEKKTVKKPAVKKEKQGVVQRIKGWWKRNWKYVAAAGGGMAAGAGATYGVGKLGERMATKRAAKVQQQDVEID